MKCLFFVPPHVACNTRRHWGLVEATPQPCGCFTRDVSKTVTSVSWWQEKVIKVAEGSWLAVWTRRCCITFARLHSTVGCFFHAMRFVRLDSRLWLTVWRIDPTDPFRSTGPTRLMVSWEWSCETQSFEPKQFILRSSQLFIRWQHMATDGNRSSWTPCLPWQRTLRCLRLQELQYLGGRETPFVFQHVSTCIHHPYLTLWCPSVLWSDCVWQRFWMNELIVLSWLHFCKANMSELMPVVRISLDAVTSISDNWAPLSHPFPVFHF